jgi:hypothetical protein
MSHKDKNNFLVCVFVFLFKPGEGESRKYVMLLLSEMLGLYFLCHGEWGIGFIFKPMTHPRIIDLLGRPIWFASWHDLICSYIIMSHKDIYI